MKCKICSAGPFNGPYQLGKHRLEAHADVVKREKLRKKRAARGVADPAPAGAPDPEHDAETELVIAANRIFTDAGLDVATNGRVLAYLTERHTATEAE